ncbi:MAG: 4-(cytidine 5'-diphospho)-2-C-methyl-D-erythritol kinase [Oscillospiraceae bacterium]|jgi:4-diphosphocytidyl-2-C-methyl-D-erythritol kinase
MQDSVSARTPAKINISLDILGKRDDGYHFVRTIMQAVSIYDEITVSPNEEKIIRIFSDNPDIPVDQGNLAYKAAAEFFRFVECAPGGLDIKIKKTIPPLAGLAGGSSNAAGTLVALNELMETSLSVEELCDIGAKVGADVPFCISGGTALAEGVGDIISSLPNLPECYIVVVKPEISISTADAFLRFDILPDKRTSEFDDLVAAVATQDIQKISSCLFNALENTAEYSEISRLKGELVEMGAMGALMTGSGSAVYGIFEKKKTASKCADEMADRYSFSRLCVPVSTGAEILD